MSDTLVDVKIINAVATLTLNRPKALNALSTAVRQELTRQFTDLNANDEVKVIILTGAGRAFCAGLDLPELQASGDQVAEEGVIGQEMLNALDNLNCPIIAAINGFEAVFDPLTDCLRMQPQISKHRANIFYVISIPIFNAPMWIQTF